MLSRVEATGVWQSWLLAGLVACLSGCRQKVEVSLVTGLNDMTNLTILCERPLGRPHLESTYDRTGGNSDWAADMSSLKTPDGLYVLADLKGPGSVNRVWTPGVIGEAWEFYFDGETQPRLSFQGRDAFSVSPFLAPLSSAISGGAYHYLPLPYAKSLRIGVRLKDYNPKNVIFYQIQYESYDKSVEVRTFPERWSVAATALQQRVLAVWSNQTTEADLAVESCRWRTNVIIRPSQTATWLDQKNPGLLRTFWIRWDNPPEASAVARAKRLREVVLRIYWDGAPEPSVDVPLGDFFCNGLHRRRFASMPIAVLEKAMVCRFPMPFRKSIRAELRNDGKEPVSFEVGWDLRPLAPEANRDLNYFHACWSSSTASGIPYRVLRAEGSGHYVGCYLIAIGTDGSWNMLEGDESMYLNGEMTASLHGTGLEDYFNGGWYYYGLFERPLFGLLEKAAMRTAQYRFHLTDPVRFEDGFLMNWEFGDGNRSQGYMSSVAYWYQPEPHPSRTRMPPVAERFPPADRLEVSSIMTSLFELERIGHYDEAAERCEFFAERYVGTELAPLLRLRAAAYAEVTGGFDSLRGKYETIAREVPTSDAGRQAQVLLWYHEVSSNAFLGVHANMRVNLYLDGQPVGEGANPYAPALLVFPQVIGPGAHEIEAEVTPLCPGPWVSFDLRTHTTNLVSDGTWECARTRPALWPRTDDVAVGWTNIVSAENDLPKMNWWQFVPNAFVNMQSGRRLIEPAWDGWDKQPFRTTYLRKRFIVPAQ